MHEARRPTEVRCIVEASLGLAVFVLVGLLKAPEGFGAVAQRVFVVGQVAWLVPWWSILWFIGTMIEMMVCG